MTLGVSIIICCYNSAKRLSNTFAHLANQNVHDSISWEIVIVDNSSKDNTRQVIGDLLTNLPFKCPVKVVTELQPGLSNARRKGMNESKYEYIVFCDDDNWLSPNYVSEAFRILNENALCGIAGSKILPAFEIGKPKWFDDYEMYYSVGERFHSSGDVTHTAGSVLGAGMITRKSIWQKIFQSNYKFLCVDRKGNNLSTGGDMEMCKIVRQLNYRIYYSNVIHLKHFIPKERLSLKYLKKNAFGVGMYYMLIQPYHYLAKKDVAKRIWVKDFIYNLIILPKAFIHLLFFRRIKFMVDFNLQLGKIYCLLSLRNQYLNNIEYIRSYYAGRK